MTQSRNRKTETLVYVCLWLIAAGIYLLNIMRSRAQLSAPLVDGRALAQMAGTMLPFLALFLVNNMVLIPRLLLKNRLWTYFSLTALAVALLWGFQYVSFMDMVQHVPARERPAPHPHMRPLLPLPLFLDFMYALLLVGGNLAIALMFQRFDDKLERESLMKTNAESRLAYLKAQINPHFYMNMLNNIHGMIEIDPEKAQSMVIDMSQLMRYTLYDSARPLIPLAEEVDFLQNYLRLMRQRYPADRLTITSSFPQPEAMRRVSVPPLLSLVFVENAFKHGVSYRDASFVSVSVSVEADGSSVRFSCMNSNHAARRDQAGRQGIGLRNVGQRLALLYGSKARLDIVPTQATYTVNLTIPAHETTDSCD